MTAFDRLRISAWMFAGFALIGCLIILGIDFIKPWAYHFEAFVWAMLVGFAFVMWILYVGAIYEEMPED